MKVLYDFLYLLQFREAMDDLVECMKGLLPPADEEADMLPLRLKQFDMIFRAVAAIVSKSKANE